MQPLCKIYTLQVFKNDKWMYVDVPILLQGPDDPRLADYIPRNFPSGKFVRSRVIETAICVVREIS